MDIARGGILDRAAARSTYRDWAETQYGPKAADRVADFDVYDYRTIPRMPSGDEHGPYFEVGDQYYQRTSRELMIRTMIDPPYIRTVGQSPQWIPPRVGQFDEPD